MSSALHGARVCILRSGPVVHDKRTLQVARLLSDAGATVTVISASRVDQERVIEPGGFTVREVAPPRSSQHPVWLLRVASNIARNAARPLLRSRKFIRAVRDVQPDIVHCMNVDTLFVGYRSVGARRYIYDSREHFATTGDVGRRTRLWWVMKERFLAPRAAAVLTVTDMIADDLSRRYRIPRPSVLLNGSTSHVTQAEPVHVPLRLIHQGKFFFDRHLEDVVEAVARQQSQAVLLTLQGWGEAEGQLRKLVSSLGAEEIVKFEEPCSPEQVVESASAHDVGIIDIWPESESHRWAGPNKLFDYMGAGLAILATNLDFVRATLETEGCGIVFDPPTADNLAKSIAYLVDNPDEVARMKRNAVAAASKYTWDAQAETLYATYEKALGRDMS